MGELQKDTAKEIAPPWLSNDSPATETTPAGVGGRLLDVLGSESDAILEKARQAALASLPGLGPDSTLPYIGADLVMPQGPGEPNAAYAVRLQGALDFWQYAGSDRAVLQQTAAYLTGYNGTFDSTVPICATVGGYNAAKWSWLNNTDSPTEPSFFTETTPNWSWDGLESTMPWRAWLILYFIGAAADLGTGSALTVASLSGGFATLTGLSGLPSTLTSATLPAYISIGGANTKANNGVFQVTAWVSSSSCIIANPKADASDANNGHITWSFSYFQGIQPAPVWDFPGTTWDDDTNVCWDVMIPNGPNTANCAGWFAGLQGVVGRAKSAGTWYVSIMCRFTCGYASHNDLTPGNEFSPWSLPSYGKGNPNGTWGPLGSNVNNVWVPTRTTGVQMGMFDAFCAGTVGFNGSPIAFGS